MQKVVGVEMFPYICVIQTNDIMSGNNNTDKPKLPKTPVFRTSERQERSVKLFSIITEKKQESTKQNKTNNSSGKNKK